MLLNDQVYYNIEVHQNGFAKSNGFIKSHQCKLSNWPVNCQIGHVNCRSDQTFIVNITHKDAFIQHKHNWP